MIALLLSLAVAGPLAPVDPTSPVAAAPAPVVQESTAEDLRGRFEEGLAAYRAEDYVSARSLWTGLLSEPLSVEDRATLLYDLGNLAFREEKTTEAVGWYTACVRLSPRHADAWINLEYARSHAGLPPADQGDLRSTLGRLLGAWTLGEARWIALLGIVPLVLVLLAEALTGERLLLLLAGPALLLWLLSALPLAYHRAAEVEPAGWMVIAERGSSLTSEPRHGPSPIGSLRAGAEVERIDSMPGWARVRTRDGLRGWLPADDLFDLQPSSK